MICFKDQTFCSNPNCDNSCGRQFTAALKAEAVKWWGSENFPLAMRDFHPLTEDTENG